MDSSGRMGFSNTGRPAICDEADDSKHRGDALCFPAVPAGPRETPIVPLADTLRRHQTYTGRGQYWNSRKGRMDNRAQALTPPTLTCPQLLSELRRAALKRKAWTDRACAVLERGIGKFAVESYEGQIVWEGDAHCTCCARIKAICFVANAANVRAFGIETA